MGHVASKPPNLFKYFYNFEAEISIKSKNSRLYHAKGSIRRPEPGYVQRIIELPRWRRFNGGANSVHDY